MSCLLTTSALTLTSITFLIVGFFIGGFIVFISMLIAKDRRRSDLEDELQKIYDSEINVRIDSFWDGGWRVALGDEMNGIIRPDWDSCDLEEVLPSLQELILKHYPYSTYAKSLQVIGKDK
jgi:hypothetical protein